jgi:hypothetical protein
MKSETLCKSVLKSLKGSEEKTENNIKSFGSD